MDILYLVHLYAFVPQLITNQDYEHYDIYPNYNNY